MPTKKKKKTDHISLTKDGEICEILGLAPGPNQLKSPTASLVLGLRVINQANHLIENLLGSDFGEDLVAIHGTGFEEVEAESLNHGALVVDLSLDGLHDLGAVELVAVDHAADSEIHAPIRFFHCLQRGLVHHLRLRRRRLKHLLHFSAHHSPHLGPTHLQPLPQLSPLQPLHREN